MLKVRKRVDGIPIFDKFDRPLYHLDSDNKSEKYVVVIDEINNIEGHYIELNDCLKEKYEKINIYTKSPLSSNTYTIEDQSSIKSVLGWISKWNKKKTAKNIKINKSKSKYVGKLNNEIPLIIKLFKFKNKKIETSTIHCNIYTDENSLEAQDKSKKSKKNVKLVENKKKQNKKKSQQKPNILCLPIKPSKFSWLKKKEQKEYDSGMSIDDFQFQNSDLSSFLPIKTNNIFDQNNFKEEEQKIDVKIETVKNNNMVENTLKRESSTELSRENSKKRNIKVEIDNKKEKSESYNEITVDDHKSTGKNKKNLQSLVIPNKDLYKTNNRSAKDLSALTIGNNEYFDYPKYQEPFQYIPSPCYSNASTLVSPVTPVTPKGDSSFEIDSCDYADYLKDRINEQSDNNEITDLERKHCSLPVSPENSKNRKTRRRSYAFSLTSNEFNLIYSEANQAVISGLCKTVEKKQKRQIEKEEINSRSSEVEKPFVKGHSRTQSRHRRSHAVCLSSDQLLNFGSEEDSKQNNRKSRYMNRESIGTSLSTYAILNSNSKSNKDTQLKRRSTNMIKGKNSCSSLSSTNSYCSNSGSMRPVSTNRLSRDIDLLRAMKMKRSRSVPKLDQPETISSGRSPVSSRFSMDATTYKENIGISIRSNSVNNLTPPSNIVYYSFNNKNENNSVLEGYKKSNNRGSYGLFADTINQQSNINSRWSTVFESSSCGSSTYYYSEEDGVHNNGESSVIVNSKEELFNYELANKTFSESIEGESPRVVNQLPPPTPMIGMI
ncbi:hypothetical protein PIROE2DRAFT_59023 [Piromyces sp. E2]|nr:hypothetical protein PIROE2DRAFT_59023 [Piromyces sp. E2]|eukprot:OUM67035.1 hypothetical protein PIROE2DRAFT_59023 [Piromyces sp. E2]